MLTRDFIVAPETGTAGDAFRALIQAKGDANWHVIVAYADHYGAIQAGKLAQSVINRGAQTALELPLRDLPIPSINAVVESELIDPDRIRRLTLALQDNRPSAVIYEPIRGSFLDQTNAKSAYDQLVAAVATSTQGAAAIPSHDFVALPETCTVGDALRALMAVQGSVNWHVIVRYVDHYGAIQAGPLAQSVINRGTQAALTVQLRELDIPTIVAVPQSEVGVPERIRQLTLALENNLPTLVYLPHRPDLISTQSAFERLAKAATVRHVESAPFSYDISFPKAPPPPAQLETTDARARYVNTWFTDRPGGEAFPRERSLARNRRYFVQLHIGPLLRESIIVAPRPIDPDLMPIPEEGLPLRVKLSSRDFEIENDTAELRLFKTGATERLYFAVAVPEKTGEARLRAGIYYQNNLVQSILLHAWVGEQEGIEPGERANWAEVEFSLSEDWADVTQLRPRRVSVFVNDSPDGTHTVGVVGTSTEGTLDIGRDKMTKAITEFRTMLLGIAMDNQKRYRYGSDNSGSQDKFVDDLKTLAYLGTALFQSIFWQDETVDFTHNLRQALDGPQPAIIQVARLSSDFVFPWAGIYDRRLMVDRDKNQVCLEPLKRDTPEAALQACSGCSHNDDTNTVCLSGFWGFRHIVEQPVSVIKNKKPTSVVREIKASGKPKVSMNVYVGDDFKLRVRHQDWVATQIKQKGGELILSDDRDDVTNNLPQPQQLCYFYCHGGSSPTSVRPWLTVGTDDRLIPDDLFGLSLDEAWRFKNVRPLVFINACHSIEFTPEALSAFLPGFATAGASGIIGTEISIFEPLAVEFAQGLIQAFLDGDPIGQAVQRLRWQLLLKRNVLGLVYTPYCYADLRLVA